MKLLAHAFALLHALMALCFACAALILIAGAIHEGWLAIHEGLGRGSAESVIEALGLLAAAVVALQIAQTISEEEVIRNAHISAPTRVRRFLSRFLVVIVVALAIEGLVATFRAHGEPQQLLYAASLVAAVALLLVGWGVFVRQNRYAEELEPEAMAEAKEEDRKVDGH